MASSTGCWKIKIDGITASDLIDTGSYFDAQDPAIKFTFGSHSFKTKRMKDAGVNAIYQDEFTLEITEEDYATKHVSEVWKLFDCVKVLIIAKPYFSHYFTSLKSK